MSLKCLHCSAVLCEEEDERCLFEASPKTPHGDAKLFASDFTGTEIFARTLMLWRHERSVFTSSSVPPHSAGCPQVKDRAPTQVSQVCSAIEMNFRLRLMCGVKLGPFIQNRVLLRALLRLKRHWLWRNLWRILLWNSGRIPVFEKRICPIAVTKVCFLLLRYWHAGLVTNKWH